MRLLRIIIPIMLALTIGAYIYVLYATRHDTTPPKIACDAEKLEISVEDAEDVLLSHLKAVDAKDGDLTKKIIIENISAFLEGNEARVTFAVSDLDNNVAKLEIPVVYTDYVKPEFRMSAPLMYYVGTQNVNTTTDVTATDLIDGDLVGRIVQSRSELDLTMPGVYPVTFRTTTSKGVTSEVTVNAYVMESKFPREITLSEYLVYINPGDKIDPKSYLTDYPTDLIEGSTENNKFALTIKDNVKYDTPGLYSISYAVIQTNKVGDTVRQTTTAQTYLNVIVRGDAA